LQEQRKKEALLVAQTAGKMDPANAQLGGLIGALEKMK